LDSEASAALRDPAREFKAKRMIDHEPEKALGWCERIQDVARQQACLESAAKEWYAQDAVAAETWLQRSPLDDEARRRVRKVPGPKRQQRRDPRRPR
jgi:hypothetical protein